MTFFIFILAIKYSERTTRAKDSVLATFVFIIFSIATQAQSEKSDTGLTNLTG